MNLWGGPGAGRFASSVVVTAALICGLLTSAALPAAGVPEADVVVRPSSVYIVGDSIAFHSRRQLHARKPAWQVDAVAGRNVRQLPELLEARMQLSPAPKNVVVALGANGHPSWGAEDYRAALELLPETTRVTFTTTWRDPQRWRPTKAGPGKLADLMDQYTRDVRQIARERPHTCVFNWHRRARRNAAKLILADGVHPTVKGRKVWARGVARTVKKCS